MTYEDWLLKGQKLFGKDKSNWQFVCPNYGNIQSIKDFEKAGIKNPETKVFFSCIGRWTGGKGGLEDKHTRPCNYTNGGLFDISSLKVIKDNKVISVFEFREMW